MRRHLSRFADALDPVTLPAELDQLTGRDRQVRQTVKTHISDILRKLHLRDRTHAVAYAHLTRFAERP